MIKEVANRCMMGIAFGGIWTFGALTILKFAEIEISVSEIWLHMLCSFILGIYYGLSSFIFQANEWSILRQTIIHFFMSITIYFIIALTAGWVILSVSVILWTTLIFIAVYAIFWTAYYLYYKKIEKTMNAELEKKE